MALFSHTDIENARSLVENIMSENGGMSDEDWRSATAPCRKAITTLRRKLGAATKTLATNIYSNDTRFVMELIQNAEDSFSRDSALFVIPFITFNVHKTKIVVESNEKGFTDDDVKAICSIGESSKKTIGGYIGEKGIGFKSVFKVASRVHIQSGPFSFSFNNGLDDGLGMVTPIPEAYKELSQNPLTRMTIALKKEYQVFESLVKQFEDLPDTLLLFLKRLKKLTYVFHDEEGGTRTISYGYQYNGETSKIATLTKTTTSSEGTTQDVKSHYWIVSRTVDNLSKDVARKTNSSEIVLAFPLTAANVPLVQTQEVYSFLPIRPVGFKFLIQADFITEASRQDIFKGPRNEDILREVALTFRDAVLEFCEHPVLQYTWIRYLTDASKVSETFWKQLLPEIQSSLKDEHIIRTRSEKYLEAPKNIRILTDAVSDENGEPLFADGDRELFISRKYESPDYEILMILGLTFASVKEILDLALKDLKSANSRFKSPLTSNKWHTSATQFLEKWLRNGKQTTKKDIRSYPLIPLHNGSWTSIMDGPIFYREDEDDEAVIPSDLGLRLFSAKSISNTSRLSFYSLLGIEHIDSGKVIDLIRLNYRIPGAVSLRCSVEHVTYFFWKCSNGQYPWPEGLTLHNREGIATSYTKTDFYFPSTSPFGIEELAKATGKKSSSGKQDPGFTVNIIHLAYLDAVSQTALSHGIYWSSFLASALKIMKTPRLLLSNQPANFSPLFNHIRKFHPEKIIGVLKTHWSAYENLITPNVIALFKDVVVYRNADENFTLCQVFIPFPSLVDICRGFPLRSKFPFMIVPPEMALEPLEHFKFLSIFGVGIDDGLEFYLQLFIRALFPEDEDYEESDAGHDESCESHTLQQRLKKMAQLYRAIHDRCAPTSREDVRIKLADCYTIYGPQKDSSLSSWRMPDECVLDAPSDFETQFPLETVEEYRKDTEIMSFFRDTLQVPTLDWNMLIDELIIMSKSNCTSREKVRDIYRRLWRSDLTVENWTLIRNTFNAENLIYVHSRGMWHKTTDCLWEAAFPIPGKVTLIYDYADLKDFFVEYLKVKTPTLPIIVSELKLLASKNPTVQDVTSLIWAINAMNPKAHDLDSLKLLEIFPVKNPDEACGQTRLESSSADFLIVDKVTLEEAFEGKVPILDFNPTQVRQLDSFLAAMDIKGRFMSLNVREETSAQGGTIDRGLCENFHDNAYALVRCAVHYYSSRVVATHERLFEYLRHAEVFRASHITKKLIIQQGGRDIISEIAAGNTGNMHISEDDGKLQIFVPKGERDRELCYLQHFPQKLIKLFNIPIQAREIIVKILQSSWVIHPMLLKEADIEEIPGFMQPEGRLFTPEPAQPRHPSPSLVEPDIFQDRPILSVIDRGSETPRHRSPSSSSSSGNSTSSSQRRNDDASSSSSASDILSPFEELSIRSNSQSSNGHSRVPSTPSTPRYTFMSGSIISEQAVAYRELLDRVIKLAQCVSFPDKNSTVVRRLGNLVPELCTDLDIALGSSQEKTQDHNNRVGAAGELYVFEFLSKLLFSETSPFSRDNWKSTMHKFVTVHEKYQNMRCWTGNETSDIVYEDTHSALTRELIARKYLPPHWASVTPKYFLEVKTTKLGCDAKLYVSKAQYELMARCKRNLLGTPPQNPEIYVIIRVFNLGRNDMDMRIYLDPKSLEEEGKLLFSADTYTVVPGNGGGL